MKTISFANQKGGAGKSICTTLLANYLHEKGERVCVIDADYQQSILQIRNLELRLMEGLDPDTLFDIYPSSPREILNLIIQLNNHYDYVLVDLPGSISSDGVLQSYAVVDYLIVVTQPDPHVFLNTQDFIRKYKENVVEKLRTDMNTRIKGCIVNVARNSKGYKEILYDKSHPLHDDIEFFDEPLFSYEALKQMSTIGMPEIKDKPNYLNGICQMWTDFVNDK